MDTPAEKLCNRCKLQKLLTDFAMDRSKKDGRYTICKSCRTLYDKARWENPETRAKMLEYHDIHREHYNELHLVYRNNNKEEVNLKKRIEYAENPEKFKKWNKKYVSSHKKQVRARQKRWNEANRARIRADRKAYRAMNADKMRAYFKDYYQRNHLWYKQYRTLYFSKYPERVRGYKRAYAERHPEYNQVRKAKRRAHEHNAPFIEHVDLEILAIRDNWRCHICGKIVTRQTWSRDHLIAVSKGGPHGDQFVALAHKVCNSRMGAGRFPAQLRLF